MRMGTRIRPARRTRGGNLKTWELAVEGGGSVVAIAYRPAVIPELTQTRGVKVGRNLSGSQVRGNDTLWRDYKAERILVFA